ncbi:HD-GYP domain-containing protein [Konateibacter massiliensis]|uniref:HD-GYP domain-containing protein n=1 Tax=Konateibacter massiliensis TaxID=2002841 RepID=UPI000C161BE4|nr:HD-GYP domain-containing protein [Konateibacter massiliensis]
MRLVATEMIDASMVLARNVYAGECLLIKSGTSNVSRYIANLKNMGIHYLYVVDELSQDIDIPDAVSEENRQRCKDILMNTLNDVQGGQTLKLNKLADNVENIISDVIGNHDLQVSLTDLSASDEYTFSHSVSTTVYGLLIGENLGYSRKKLSSLAMGILLHDIGKVVLDHDIVYKEDALTDEEFEYVKKHTECGYELLKDAPNIPAVSKEIALNHHEKLDGSGYPRGLKGEQLTEFARISAIADVYDALTSDRCYRKKWPTNKAVDFLIENSGTKFDADLVRIFIQRIAVYPNGSMVRLSDGTLALVKEQNRYMPLRPVVKVIADKYGDKVQPYEINLMDVLSVTVTESEIEITKSVLEQKREYTMEEEAYM